MKRINLKVVLTTSDSGYTISSKANQMSSGMASILMGKWTNLITSNSYKDLIG